MRAVSNSGRVCLTRRLTRSRLVVIFISLPIYERFFNVPIRLADQHRNRERLLSEGRFPTGALRLTIIFSNDLKACYMEFFSIFSTVFGIQNGEQNHFFMKTRVTWQGRNLQRHRSSFLFLPTGLCRTNLYWQATPYSRSTRQTLFTMASISLTTSRRSLICHVQVGRQHMRPCEKFQSGHGLSNGGTLSFGQKIRLHHK